MDFLVRRVMGCSVGLSRFRLSLDVNGRVERKSDNENWIAELECPVKESWKPGNRLDQYAVFEDGYPFKKIGLASYCRVNKVKIVAVMGDSTCATRFFQNGSGRCLEMRPSNEPLSMEIDR